MTTPAAGSNSAPHQEAPPMIELNGLTKRYVPLAADDLSFRLQPGWAAAAQAVGVTTLYRQKP